jgi:hypothetical protein
MARRRTLGIALALTVATGSLLAINPHYVVDPSITVDNTSLFLSAKAAGLGDVPDVNFTVTGTVDLFSRCYNRGGNKPQADNKQETIEIDATFTAAVNNGQTTITRQLVATAQPTLDCPGNQIVVVEDFSFNLLLAAAGFPQLTTTLASN